MKQRLSKKTVCVIVFPAYSAGLNHELSVVEVAVKHLHTPSETLPPGLSDQGQAPNLSAQGQAPGSSDQGRGFPSG